MGHYAKVKDGIIDKWFDDVRELLSDWTAAEQNT